MYRHFSSMLSLITGYCFQTVLFDIVQVSEIGQLHNAISFIFKLDRLLSSLYAQAHFCVCYCFIIFFKSSSSFKYSKITGHIFNTLHQYIYNINQLSLWQSNPLWLLLLFFYLFEFNLSLLRWKPKTNNLGTYSPVIGQSRTKKVWQWIFNSAFPVLFRLR